MAAAAGRTRRQRREACEQVQEEGEVGRGSDVYFKLLAKNRAAAATVPRHNDTVESAVRIKTFKKPSNSMPSIKTSFVTRRLTHVPRGHPCPWASCRRCLERGQQLKMMMQQQQQQQQLQRRQRRLPLQLLLPKSSERLQQQLTRRRQGRCRRMTTRSAARETWRKAGE
jgi:hypothetical protein